MPAFKVSAGLGSLGSWLVVQRVRGICDAALLVSKRKAGRALFVYGAVATKRLEATEQGSCSASSVPADDPIS